MAARTARRAASPKARRRGRRRRGTRPWRRTTRARPSVARISRSASMRLQAASISCGVAQLADLQQGPAQRGAVGGAGGAGVLVAVGQRRAADQHEAARVARARPSATRAVMPRAPPVTTTDGVGAEAEVAGRRRGRRPRRPPGWCAGRRPTTSAAGASRSSSSSTRRCGQRGRGRRSRSEASTSTERTRASWRSRARARIRPGTPVGVPSAWTGTVTASDPAGVAEQGRLEVGEDRAGVGAAVGTVVDRSTTRVDGRPAARWRSGDVGTAASAVTVAPRSIEGGGDGARSAPAWPATTADRRAVQVAERRRPGRAARCRTSKRWATAAAGRRCVLAARGPAWAAVGGLGGRRATASPAARASIHSTMPRSDLCWASSSTSSSSTADSSSPARPMRSASSPTISMRLMESMLRSASRSRSGSSISTG